MDMPITDHSLLQPLHVLLGLLPPVLHHPAERRTDVTSRTRYDGKQADYMRGGALRELLQLAALLLVGGLELLVLHLQPLVLQDDLLVQAAQTSAETVSAIGHIQRREALADVMLCLTPAAP